MNNTIRNCTKLFIFAMLAVGFLAVPRFAFAGADQDVAGAVKSKLDKSQYKDVQVSVDANGVATLSGTVSLYEYKADADKTAHKVKGVTAVRNDITVAGPNISDAQLQKSLSEKLSYDRVGYG
ncbi:MAG: BON domain-containing protein, partial [Terracidiphilus sp.]